MKIAIVAHGRFHAFDLAKAMIRLGHDVTVFTNYPGWAARKFGLPAKSVRGFWGHLVLYKLVYAFSRSGRFWDTSTVLNPIFGRWVAAQVAKERYDLVHCFSGVATELLSADRRSGPAAQTAHLIVRGSAHIEIQDAILAAEEERAKCKVERPSRTVIQRELKEYGSADRIVVLSSFAYRSFLDKGIPAERLALLPLGVDVSQFAASREVLEARHRRIAGGEPLRVLWVGTMSLQKGILDYVEVVKGLAGGNFQFRFVGNVVKALGPWVDQVNGLVEFVPRQRQWDLHAQYAWADVFIFPTIQDGFAVVLAQAAANGLPILTTTNCAGPDMIRDGVTGWILPIRSPQAFIERLRWCDQNREVFAAMAKRITDEFVPRTWDDVARDFSRICQGVVENLRARLSDGSRAAVGARGGTAGPSRTQ